jgi:hypothetical protein
VTTISADAVAAGAVELARQAAVLEAGDSRVGAHLEVVAEDTRVVTHLFDCADPAYRGWRWSVTVARPPRARSVTVDEVALVAGPDSIIAPEWVPFGERLRADDLGIGDIIPADPDDPRLVPAYTDAILETDSEALGELWWDFGLGRERVLSPEGLEEVADRWASGEWGPGSAMARHADQPCGTCGFLVPLGGRLGSAFGACTNALSPADGSVVSMDFGCGAHSQSMLSTLPTETTEVFLDETGYDAFDIEQSDAAEQHFTAAQNDDHKDKDQEEVRA